MRLSLAVVLLAAALMPTPAHGDDAASPELAARERRVAHHLLRVQQRRFEARARGESTPALKRLDREFQRTQNRWREARAAIATPEQ